MSPGLQPCLAKNQFPTFHDPLCHYLQIDMRFLELVAEAFACLQHVVIKALFAETYSGAGSVVPAPGWTQAARAIPMP